MSLKSVHLIAMTRWESFDKFFHLLKLILLGVCEARTWTEAFLLANQGFFRSTYFYFVMMHCNPGTPAVDKWRFCATLHELLLKCIDLFFLNCLKILVWMETAFNSWDEFKIFLKNIFYFSILSIVLLDIIVYKVVWLIFSHLTTCLVVLDLICEKLGFLCKMIDQSLEVNRGKCTSLQVHALSCM